MKLATHLHMSLQRCKRETTSREFERWKIYLTEEPNHFHREDFYLAQIARNIDRMFSKHPQKFKTKHYLLKFVPSRESKPIEDPKKRMDTSKMAWGALVGIKIPGG